MYVNHKIVKLCITMETRKLSRYNGFHQVGYVSMDACLRESEKSGSLFVSAGQKKTAAGFLQQSLTFMTLSVIVLDSLPRRYQ
jgi:hypothetical protein